MSNSELLRIKNEQKTLLKNKRLQAVIKKYNKRPNDRFGFNVPTFGALSSHNSRILIVKP